MKIIYLDAGVYQCTYCGQKLTCKRSGANRAKHFYVAIGEYRGKRHLSVRCEFTRGWVLTVSTAQTPAEPGQQST